MSFFIRGLILGLSIAAPVDPLGVLCIRRTVTQGRVIGFVSGLGAATADAIYGAIAGFGLTAVAHLLVGGQQVLRIVGAYSCFILASGPGEHARRADHRRPIATGG